MTADTATTSLDQADTTAAEPDVSDGARCWACTHPFTIDDWADRHGPGPEDPDHVEYHAHCCPDCCGEVAS